MNSLFLWACKDNQSNQSKMNFAIVFLLSYFLHVKPIKDTPNIPELASMWTSVHFQSFSKLDSSEKWADLYGFNPMSRIIN